MIDSLTAEIDEADRELKKLAKSDSTCKRMMTVPGVGPVTAVRFVAALDEVGVLMLGRVPVPVFVIVIDAERNRDDASAGVGPDWQFRRERLR